MEFDNSFEVPLRIDEAWRVLMDIRRVAPCMPGAELTDVVDDRTYKGKIAVRLGPVALAFAGIVKFDEIDEAAHRARVSAQGSDTKGRGGANASASFHLESDASGATKVLVHTNLTLSGSVAQYGRGVGIIQITAGQIITQFANNLKAQLAPRPPSGDVMAATAAPDAGAADAIAPAAAAAAAPPLGPLNKATTLASPTSASTPAATASVVLPSSGASASSAIPLNEMEKPPASQTSATKPISGFALMGRVLWEGVKRLFGWRQNRRL